MPELKDYNFMCYACGASLKNRASFHIDHIHPKSRGGSDHPRNLQILCAHCNLSKGAKTMKEWRPWLLKEDDKPINTWQELGWQPYRHFFPNERLKVTNNRSPFRGKLVTCLGYKNENVVYVYNKKAKVVYFNLLTKDFVSVHDKELLEITDDDFGVQVLIEPARIDNFEVIKECIENNKIISYDRYGCENY